MTSPVDRPECPRAAPTNGEAVRWTRRNFLSATVAMTTAAVASRTGAADTPATVERDPLLITTNPVMARARDAALEVLKPTRAHLERGLDLHRRSLVFDAYGFAPRAALDSARMIAALESGASDAEVQDLQEELGMTQATVVAAERAEFDEAMRCSGVTAIFQNAGEEGQDPLRLMKRLARFTYLTDQLRGTLMRATLPDDVEAAHRAGLHCLYLTGNGVPLPQTWITVEEELSYVRLFFQLGIRMMHVTYNRRNMLGDGCAETANGGLSDFGRAAIAEMNRVGIIVDVAHSGWRTSLEAAQASQKPMVASHTVCAGLRDHIRAKPDEVIRAICDTGGLIGICWIPQFLGGSGDVAALLDHVDYAVKRFGVDHVAIGTDVAHTSQYAPTAAKAIPSRGRRRTRFEALWPEGALGGQWPRSGSLGWTNWPLVTVGLVQRGYRDEDIRKILSANVLRVCREVLPPAMVSG
ncbi:MAG: membrane dipeptidase [Planctomycetaceae bacterium]|nr:membrane dipeptidase [Planctomycetaceae bacterium]